MARDAIQVKASEISANSPGIDRPFCDSLALPFICRAITARPPPLVGVNVVTSTVWRQITATLVLCKRPPLRAVLLSWCPPARLTLPNMAPIFLPQRPSPRATQTDRRLMPSPARNVSRALPAIF